MSTPGIAAPCATASLAARTVVYGSVLNRAAAVHARRDSGVAAAIGTPAAKKMP